MRPFQELVVWQKAHQLALAVYHESRAFLGDERFGLTSQLRRSAVSIPANIAEGSARPGETEFRRFLGIALGSATELEYHLILSRDLGYISRDTHARLDVPLAAVKRMLVAFIRRLQDAPPPRPTDS